MQIDWKSVESVKVLYIRNGFHDRIWNSWGFIWEISTITRAFCASFYKRLTYHKKFEKTATNPSSEPSCVNRMPTNKTYSSVVSSQNHRNLHATLVVAHTITFVHRNSDETKVDLISANNNNHRNSLNSFIIFINFQFFNSTRKFKFSIV